MILDAIQKDQQLLDEIAALKEQLSEYKELVDAIRSGAVDALAITKDGRSDVYTLESTDFVYRILVENFGESALNVSDTGIIVYANSAFENLIGMSNSAIIGTEIAALIDADSKPEFTQLFAKAFSGHSRGEVTLSYKYKQIPVYISLSSLYPKYQGIGIIMTDLTEKKRTEKAILNYQSEIERLLQVEINQKQKTEEKNKELEKSNDELESFNYIASHDLQEPLRKIQTFTGMIVELDKRNLSEKSLSYFQKIESAAARMQALIKSLAQYSRVSLTKPAFEDTDLNTLVKDIVEEIKDSEKTRVDFKIDELPHLSVIPVQFKQLFLNLFQNSIKYRNTDRPLEITVSCKHVKRAADDNSTEANYWQISVTDNGIGFDMQYSGKIFDLFQRLHDKTVYEGTGIGLAICKKIAENHGGFIVAMSTPGNGATFQILIPQV